MSKIVMHLIFYEELRCMHPPLGYRKHIIDNTQLENKFVLESDAASTPNYISKLRLHLRLVKCRYF